MELTDHVDHLSHVTPVSLFSSKIAILYQLNIEPKFIRTRTEQLIYSAVSPQYDDPAEISKLILSLILNFCQFL